MAVISALVLHLQYSEHTWLCQTHRTDIYARITVTDDSHAYGVSGPPGPSGRGQRCSCPDICMTIEYSVDEQIQKTGRTILVIDDEDTMHDSCTQTLEREGHRVLCSYTGSEGLAILRDQRPDAVLLDLKLPRRSGITVLQEISVIDPTIVTVVITGYATIETAVEAMKYGASDFLPKPFTPDELRFIVNRALEKRKLLVKTKKLEEEKNRIKENFVTIITHELRSPLVAVEQYFEVLLEGIAGEIQETQREILSKCKRRVMWLLSMVNEWLSMARIQDTLSLKEPKECSIDRVLEEAIDLVRIQAEEKNIDIVFTVPAAVPAFMGNHELLIHLFMNLYSNAIKYNLPGGRITSTVTDMNGSLNVCIQDTGMGIPEECIPFIFDEFYRVRRNSAGANQKYRDTGTGLGLAIVKKIVDAHNGEISVVSTVDIGTTFTVTLPKKQPLKPVETSNQETMT